MPRTGPCKRGLAMGGALLWACGILPARADFSAYSIPLFEFNEENRIAGDSRVALDNLSVVLVPEPASLAYLVAGLWAFLVRVRRRRWCG